MFDFYKGLTYRRLLFEIRHLDKLHKLYDKFKYNHDRQSAQILQKHDGYNTYVVIEAQDTHRT